MHAGHSLSLSSRSPGQLAARPALDHWSAGPGTCCRATLAIEFQVDRQTFSKIMTARDYSETLFLPRTDFPMRAGLPQKEPQLLARWQQLGLYERLRAAAKGRPKFILHDGPPYANGNIHIGHALNKILKDVVTRSQQMLGQDFELRAGLGLPRTSDRMEDRGGIPRQGQEQGRRAGGGIPPGVPRLRRALGRGAAGGIQAARGGGRLGPPLHHHGLRRRGADRARAHEVRPERHALSRLEAGDVVGGGEDRPG